MPRIKIDSDKCKGCMLCIEACSAKLIKRSKKMNKKGVYAVDIADMKKCTGCVMCAIMCPDVCIEVYK